MNKGWAEHTENREQRTGSYINTINHNWSIGAMLVPTLLRTAVTQTIKEQLPVMVMPLWPQRVNRRGFAKFLRSVDNSSEDVPPPDVEHVHDRDVGVHDDVRRPPHRPRIQTQGDRRGLVGVDGEVLQIRWLQLVSLLSDTVVGCDYKVLKLGIKACLPGQFVQEIGTRGLN